MGWRTSGSRSGRPHAAGKLSGEVTVEGFASCLVERPRSTEQFAGTARPEQRHAVDAVAAEHRHVHEAQQRVDLRDESGRVLPHDEGNGPALLGQPFEQAAAIPTTDEVPLHPRAEQPSGAAHLDGDPVVVLRVDHEDPGRRDRDVVDVPVAATPTKLSVVQEQDLVPAGLLEAGRNGPLANCASR